MHRSWDRWLCVGLLTVLVFGGAAALTPAQPNAPGSKPLLDTDGALTTKDPRDPTQKEPYYCKIIPLRLEQGKTYRIDLVSDDFDGFLRLEDPSGKTVSEDDDSGGGLNARIIYKAATSGPHKLVVSSFRPSQTGKFHLTAALEQGGTPLPPPTVAGKTHAMPPFQPVLRSEVVSQLTPEDAAGKEGQARKVFTFTARPNRMYVVRLNARTFDARVQLQDANGKALKDEDYGHGHHSQLVIPPGPGGALRLVVTALAPKQYGDFNLSITEREPTPPAMQPVVFDRVARTDSALTTQDSVDGQGKYFKVFVIKTRPGQTYACELTARGFEGYLRLADSKGNVVRNEDAGDKGLSLLTFKADTATTLHLIATSLKPGQTGPFTLLIAEREKVAKDEPVAAPQEKATTLTLKDGKVSRAAQLMKDDPTLPGGQHFHEYTFKAEAGKAYRIDLHSKAFDAYLLLKDATGKELAENDDNGESLDSRIVRHFDQAGTYRVTATSLEPGKTGLFLLSIKTIESGPLQVSKLGEVTAKPATVKGQLTTKDGVDSLGRYEHGYSFAAEKGHSYRFEMSGTAGLDPQLRVETGSGKAIKGEDIGDGKRSQLLFTAPARATYVLIASTFKAGMTGEFTLSASTADLKITNAEPLKLENGSATVEGRLTPASPRDVVARAYQAYALAAVTGKRYAFELRSNDKGLNPLLRVEDRSGVVVQPEEYGDQTLSRLTFQPAKAGTYYVVASSFRPKMAGGYTLTAREQAAPGKTPEKKATDDEKLINRIKQLPDASAAERKKILEEVTDYLAKKNTKLTALDANLATEVGQELELSDLALAARAYAVLGKLIAAASEPKVAAQGKLLLNAAKRVNLVGQPLAIKGTTVGGKTFDLAKEKGNVVLVDFWATWCGPCRAELPNVKKLYAKYHDRGFDVIGISLDNSEKALKEFLAKEKLPWPSIYKEANELADSYGVFSIPLAILVGRDGRVLSLHARGAELERLLQKELPEKK